MIVSPPRARYLDAVKRRQPVPRAQVRRYGARTCATEWVVVEAAVVARGGPRTMSPSSTAGCSALQRLIEARCIRGSAVNQAPPMVNGAPALSASARRTREVESDTAWRDTPPLGSSHWRPSIGGPGEMPARHHPRKTNALMTLRQPWRDLSAAAPVPQARRDNCISKSNANSRCLRQAARLRPGDRDLRLEAWFIGQRPSPDQRRPLVNHQASFATPSKQYRGRRSHPDSGLTWPGSSPLPPRADRP